MARMNSGNFNKLAPQAEATEQTPALDVTAEWVSKCLQMRTQSAAAGQTPEDSNNGN